jgi:DNA gyrase subunit A
VLAIRDYEQAPYLVLATRNGLVKKTRLGDYNSPRQAGVIAINFREDDDELIGAELVGPDDDILLVSRKGSAIRFKADDGQLRPMGRATSGVTGMKFRTDADAVLSMSVIRAEQIAVEDDPSAAGQKVQYVFTITDGGFAKRTPISQYRITNRGGLGIKAMGLTNEERGGLVGGFIVEDGDEILSITNAGQVVRSPINEDFRPTGRSAMGVKFVTPKNGDAVAVVARSVEAKETDEEPLEEAVVEGTVDESIVAGGSSAEATDPADGGADAGTANAAESDETAEDATIETDQTPEGDA